MLACQQQGQKKPCTRSCLFTTLPNPNRQTSQPAHSTSQSGGRSGKDLVQLHRDGQGHLECDPGGIMETMVSTHTGAASRAGETLSVCTPGRRHHRTQSGQTLSHEQTSPRRGLSPSPQGRPPSTPHHRLTLDLEQTQQRKGCKLGLLLG